ncbi:hypothetical protein BGZ50_007189 [Haplosporangium sp. Z 11]|nr:hypothetical protein BGZ50_007189 [Haplosporangium sp. Z 11]
MFGLKFKKKVDPAASTAEPGPKTEAATITTTTTNATTTRTENAPAPSSSAGNGQIGRSDSNGSANLHLKTSLTSLNNQQYRNNNTSGYNFDTNLAQQQHHQYHQQQQLLQQQQLQQQLHQQLQYAAEVNYKVPLDEGSDSIKVPVDESAGCPPRSHTFGPYSNHHSSLPTSVSAPGLTSNNNNNNNDLDWRSNQPPQAPRTNLATKPAFTHFGLATVTSSVIPNASATAAQDSMIISASATSLPTSAASSATPSRNSSTSTRGGGGSTGAGGMSTIGSFTPLSVTPPMTPCVAHEVVDVNFAVGQDIARRMSGVTLGSNSSSSNNNNNNNSEQLNHGASRDSWSSHPQHTRGATAATMGMGMGMGQQQIPIINRSMNAPGEDESVMSPGGALVSSPTSFQPSSNSLTAAHLLPGSSLFPQDSFQHQYMLGTADDRSALLFGASSQSILGGAGTVTSSSVPTPPSLITNASTSANGIISRAKSLSTAASCAALLQQQKYQQQLMQSCQDLDNNSSSGSNSNDSMDACRNIGSSSDADAHDSQQHLLSPEQLSPTHSHNPPLASAVAVAAALADSTAEWRRVEPQQENTVTTTTSSSIPTASLLQLDEQQSYHPRDRTLSASGPAGIFESPTSLTQTPHPLSAPSRAIGSQSPDNANQYTPTIATAGSNGPSHDAPPPSIGVSNGNGGGSGNGGTHGGIAGGGSNFFPAPISRASTAMPATHLITHDIRQTSEGSHIEEGAGPLVLMAIGKTGQGKSSLLNKIMGTSELKASASVRAVTKGIAERTGWGRFEDSRRVLVTLADTPGLADTEGDDEKNIPILKEYIKSVGKRLGVSAFLLVFKIDSGVDMIITILQTFNDIMSEFPNFWDNVVLVFTGCDYRRNVMNTKQFYHEEIQQQLKEHFFKDRYSNSNSSSERPILSTESSTTTTSSTSTNTTTSSSTVTNGSSGALLSEDMAPVVPMVFLSCAEAPCGFSLGERCDCKARTTYLNAGIKRLWYAVKSKKRWVLVDQDEDNEFLGHS